MTVKELIAELEKHPPDAIVLNEARDSQANEVRSVETVAAVLNSGFMWGDWSLEDCYKYWHKPPKPEQIIQAVVI